MIRRLLPLMLVTGAVGCFPTFQAARIDPGLHVDAGISVIHDQVRDGQSQGPDYIGYLAPSFGFGDRIELGIPFGTYLPDGFQTRSNGYNRSDPVLLPYIKAALLPPGPAHLALSVQTLGFVIPANLGLQYGRNLGSWEPQVGASIVFSGGPAGDDPYVRRYQELHQFLATLSVGASWRGPGRPAVAIGVLRNHFLEGAVLGNTGQPVTPRTQYDLFVQFKVGWSKR